MEILERICIKSFGISIESFLVIEFTSKKKTHKKVYYDSVNKIIKNTWMF